jgi:hypothetical protein
VAQIVRMVSEELSNKKQLARQEFNSMILCNKAARLGRRLNQIKSGLKDLFALCQPILDELL